MVAGIGVAAEATHTIFSGSYTDNEFSGGYGQPKDLPATDLTGSLPSLLKRYAGDLRYGAIRKDMPQRGLIEELEERRYRHGSLGCWRLSHL